MTFKRETDVELMLDCILPSMREKEFFLRKAIGWALREYAKVDAETVLAFVRRHEEELSGLSKREAMKGVRSSLDVGRCAQRPTKT